MRNLDYEKLIEIVVKVLSLHPDEITRESRFCEDLGADSLDMYQMAMEVEKTFQIDLSNVNLGDIVTVEDAFRVVNTAKSK